MIKVGVEGGALINPNLQYIYKKPPYPTSHKIKISCKKVNCEVSSFPISSSDSDCTLISRT